MNCKLFKKSLKMYFAESLKKKQKKNFVKRIILKLRIFWCFGCHECISWQQIQGNHPNFFFRSLTKTFHSWNLQFCCFGSYWPGDILLSWCKWTTMHNCPYFLSSSNIILSWQVLLILFGNSWHASCIRVISVVEFWGQGSSRFLLINQF